MTEVDTWDALLAQPEVKQRAKRLQDEALAAAERLALQLRLRYYRDKGRKPTLEAISRWCAKNLRSEQSRHFQETAIEVRLLATRPLRWLEVIVMSLEEKADDATKPKRGRRKSIIPALGTSMLSSMSPPPRSVGRPRALGPDDELAFLRFVYGVKLKLYRRRRYPDSRATFDDTLGLLRRDPDLSGPVAAFLDGVIPDTEAVAHPAVQKRLRGGVKALSKRLQRARDRYPYRLPDPA